MHPERTPKAMKKTFLCLLNVFLYRHLLRHAYRLLQSVPGALLHTYNATLLYVITPRRLPCDFLRSFYKAYKLK